jgi:hypothetical protein
VLFQELNNARDNAPIFHVSPTLSREAAHAFGPRTTVETIPQFQFKFARGQVRALAFDSPLQGHSSCPNQVLRDLGPASRRHRPIAFDAHPFRFWVADCHRDMVRGLKKKTNEFEIVCLDTV